MQNKIVLEKMAFPDCFYFFLFLYLLPFLEYNSFDEVGDYNGITSPGDTEDEVLNRVLQMRKGQG